MSETRKRRNRQTRLARTSEGSADLLALLKEWQAIGRVLRENGLIEDDVMQRTASLLGRLDK